MKANYVRITAVGNDQYEVQVWTPLSPRNQDGDPPFTSQDVDIVAFQGEVRVEPVENAAVDLAGRMDVDFDRRRLGSDREVRYCRIENRMDRARE